MFVNRPEHAYSTTSALVSNMTGKDKLCFDDNFVDFVPPNHQSAPPMQLQPVPNDPLYNLIDSDRYIKSLENKLRKLKGGTRKEPTAKEMIQSLEKSKEEYFRKIDENQAEYVSNFVQESCDQEASYSALERRLHPDRIAIDPEELVELLEDDDVGKRSEANVHCESSTDSQNQTEAASKVRAESQIIGSSPRIATVDRNDAIKADSSTETSCDVKRGGKCEEDDLQPENTS